MPTGPGAADSRGIYHLGESDDEGLFTDTLKLATDSISTEIGNDRTRLTAAEAAILLRAPLTSLHTKRLIPTISSTGGTVTVGSDGIINGSGAITQLKVTIPSASSYKRIQGCYDYIGGASGSHTIKLASAGTAEPTASSYRGQGRIDSGTSATAAPLTAGTSWTHGYTGARLERSRSFSIRNLAAAKRTTWYEWGADSDASTNELSFQGSFRHTVSTALDGFIFDFSSLGTFVEFQLELEGVL